MAKRGVRAMASSSSFAPVPIFTPSAHNNALAQAEGGRHIPSNRALTSTATTPSLAPPPYPAETVTGVAVASSTTSNIVDAKITSMEQGLSTACDPAAYAPVSTGTKDNEIDTDGGAVAEGESHPRPMRRRSSFLRKSVCDETRLSFHVV